MRKILAFPTHPPSIAGFWDLRLRSLGFTEIYEHGGKKVGSWERVYRLYDFVVRIDMYPIEVRSESWGSGYGRRIFISVYWQSILSWGGKMVGDSDEEMEQVLNALAEPDLLPTCVGISWADNLVEAYMKSR